MTTPAIHQCPNLPPEGISIYLDPHSTLLCRAPTWQLDIQREATEADLEENRPADYERPPDHILTATTNFRIARTDPAPS